MARSQGVPGLTPFQNENMNVETWSRVCDGSLLTAYYPLFSGEA